MDVNAARYAYPVKSTRSTMLQLLRVA